MVQLNTCNIQCGAALESYPTARKNSGLYPACQALLQKAYMFDLVVERPRGDSESDKTTLKIKKKTSIKAASLRTVSDGTILARSFQRRGHFSEELIVVSGAIAQIIAAGKL
jgi:hypothetical protein